MNIWHFRTSGEAYDASQSQELIRSGDLLVTPVSVGVLYRAWPVWVKGEVGAFHQVTEGTLADLDDGALMAQYLAAMEVTFATKADIRATNDVLYAHLAQDLEDYGFGEEK